MGRLITKSSDAGTVELVGSAGECHTPLDDLHIAPLHEFPL